VVETTNKCVTVVSSYLSAEPHGDVQRYDRKQKQCITVDRPCIIEEYNQSMGGVDLLDIMRSLCKYPMKFKRRYLYIFYHALTIALVNAWFLYRRNCKELGSVKCMPLRKFQSQVATALCQAGKSFRADDLPAKKKPRKGKSWPMLSPVAHK